MRKLFILLKTYAKNAFGKGRKNRASSALVATLLTLLVGGYCTMMAIVLGSALAAEGQLHLLLLLSGVMSIAITLFLSMYSASGVLFKLRDYDLLMSLPIRQGVVVASKITYLLLFVWAVNLLTCLPFIIVYGVLSGAGVLAYLFMVLGLLLLPVPFMSLACFLAYILGIISSRMKYKNLVNILGTFLLLALVLVISFQLNGAISSLMQNGSALADNLTRMVMPLGHFLGSALAQSWLDLFLLLLWAVLPFTLLCLFISCSFVRTNTRMESSGKRGGAYQLQAARTRSPLSALVRREVRSYFAIPIYVINSAFGGVLLLLFSSWALFFAGDNLAALLDVPDAERFIPALGMLASAFIVGISTTTAASISLEGSSLWIAKTLPVSFTTLFKSKIALQLIIMVPSILISLPMMALAFQYSLLTTLLMLAFLLLLCLFVAMAGLFINLCFPRLDWTTPTVVVKQSLSTFVSVMLGMALPIALVVALSLGIPPDIVLLWSPLVLLLLNAGLWLLLRTNGVRRFYHLS